jgi:hypothetical protein
MKHYEQYIEKKKFHERSRKLAADAKELGLAQKQAQEYEKLDKPRQKDSMKHNNNAGNSVGGGVLVTKNYTTGHQSPILEVVLQ